ncbi:helix-turn-helix domain-containing protein [Flavobacterium sp. DGU11]|uniref:Helix-turn-helix domain-containing protein n=1 Tax=Flavobacterium arundinis TaxID=3139143 RepID=A0ABU9I129_9FLAO
MQAKMQLIEMSPETLAELIVQKAQALFEKFVNTCIQCTEKEILTPKEVCELLNIDDSTLWHWRNDGKVKVYGIAGRRYYKRSEIMESLIPMTPKKRTFKKAA